MKKYKKIYVEITNICNLNCSFCGIDDRKKEFMSLDNFEKVLQKINNYTDYIYLHVKGEPLLHPNLKEILELANKYNLKVNLTTNGTLIDKYVEVFNNSPNLNKINISLHCENNDKKYLDKVFNTCEKIKNKTIVYRIWTLNNGKFTKKSTKIVDKMIEHYNLSPEIVNKIINNQNIKIKKDIYLDKDSEFTWPDINSKNHILGYCMALKTQIAILVDGTVVPCCLDSKGIINLGNIFENDLEDIINSERYQILHKSFRNHHPSEELCLNCSFKERFNK